MTVADIIVSNQKNRGIALMTLRSVLNTINSSVTQKDFINRYLFGISGSEGLCNVLDAYFGETNILTSRQAQKPASLIDAAAWNLKLSYACSATGDAPLESDVNDVMYPQSNSIPSPTLNKGCSWFSNSKDTGNRVSVAGSIYQLAAGIVTAVGSNAAIGSLRPTQSYGLGVKGSRTCDNGPNSGSYGYGTPDSPDYFNNGVLPYPNAGAPYSNVYSTLFNSMSSLITRLNDYIDHANLQIVMLQKIQSGTNSIFVESGMSADAPVSDIATLQSNIITVQGFIAGIQVYQSYFSQFSPANSLVGQVGYDKTTFDTKLDQLVTSLSPIQSFCLARSASVPLGNVPTGTEPTTGLRKWLLFWVTQLAGKPISPYSALTGLSKSYPYGSANAGMSAQANAEIGLANCKTALDTLLGDTAKYLEKPVVVAVYYNPVMDSIAKTILSSRVTLILNGTLAANRHSVYRHDITVSIPTDNTAWSEVPYADITAVDLGSGFVKLSFDDVSVLAAHSYLYRVKSFDTSVAPFVEARLDSYDTSSEQSDIFTAVTVAALSVTANRVVTAGHSLVSGQTVHCSSTNKFYKVGGVSPTDLMLVGSVIPDSAVPFTLTVVQGAIFL